MSHREFIDQKGQKWDVWQVLPTSAERRGTERRAPARAGAGAYSGEERRGLVPDRRVRDFHLASSVNEGFEGGWLCFESSEGEKRRLAPVPPGWEKMGIKGLLKLCSDAKRVVRCGVR